MALTTITLHGKIVAPVTNAPASGTVTFKILQELRDNLDNTIYSPQTFTAALDVNGEFNIVLPVTDDPNVTPLDWSYWVYVDTSVWTSEVFYIPLPGSLGPVAEFADILPLAHSGTGCTPDGTPCAPIGSIAALQAQIDALEAEVAGFGAMFDEIETQLDALSDDVATNAAAIADLQAQITTINGDITTLNNQIVALQTALATLQGQVATNTANIATNTANIATNTTNIATNTADIATLQGQILNINAAWITSGILPFARLAGTIPENSTVTLWNRPTLVSPGTAADSWQWLYNGVRTVYGNEYNLLRVRGIPDVQVPVRFMSNLARDNTTLATFQVSLSDAATHWFQVLANGDILGPNGLSMLPSTASPVVFTAPAGNAATISDGTGTGAPYALTTTLMAANNRVFLDGAVANNGGANIVGGTVLFTVVAAHRPAAWVQFNERTSTTLSARVTIRPDGTCRIDQQLAIGATFSLDGLNYRKAA